MNDPPKIGDDAQVSVGVKRYGSQFSVWDLWISSGYTG